MPEESTSAAAGASLTAARVRATCVPHLVVPRAGCLPALVFTTAAFVACRSPLSAMLLPKVTLPEQFHQSLASCDAGSKPR